MSRGEERIRTVSEAMYDAYGMVSNVGMPYFLEYLHEFSECDPVDMLAFQMKTYPHSYVLEFFLSTPFVWGAFCTSDWLHLMHRAGPRPDPARNVDEMSEFCDIEFVSRFLGVDGLAAFARLPGLPELDASRATDYFRVFPHLLDPRGAEYLELDGELLVGRRKLNEVGKRLLGEGIFSSL